MYIYVQHISILIILIILIIVVYIKIKYPFWNIQPVFHNYDFWRYYCRVPNLIQRGYSIKTKYTDFENVKSIAFLEMSSKQQNEFVNVLQCYLVRSDRVINNINYQILHTYLSGHSNPAFVSIYYNPVYSLEHDISNNQLQLINTPNAIGCISSRPIKFFVKDIYDDTHEHNVYFIDHICEHREFQEKNIIRRLIQTHEYNQRNKTIDCPVSLFKHEGELLKGIVPLVKFDILTFFLKPVKPPPLPPHFTVTKIEHSNNDMLLDFLFEISRKKSSTPFRVAAFPEINSIANLIKNKIWYIYALQSNNTMYGLYFLKDTNTIHEDISVDNTNNIANSLECVTSISNMVSTLDSNSLFFAGFLNTLYQINVLKHRTYKVITFQDIANNDIIIERWKWKYSPLFETVAGYYIYNMVCPRMPLNARNAFVLL